MWDVPTRANSAAEAPSAAAVDRSGSNRRTRQPAATEYAAAIDSLLASYRAIPSTARVRLAKRTSNLFRTRQPTAVPGLDVSGLQGVFSVDTNALTADVGGMCTYEDLVAATLPVGLAPLVVPQLKTITVGGAATGGGIESSSFRTGLVFDDIVELDVLTGAGEVITASPEENPELFFGFANSYGTLGYATRLRVRLERVKPFVALRHVRFTRLETLEATIESISQNRLYEGTPVDYLDGVVFSKSESYLTLGTGTDEPGPVSDYTGQHIYYRSIQQRATDRLTIRDYLWRWDTDWFWCSRAFGAQHPLVRRLWPKRLRRSSFYWKLVALDRRFDIADRLEKLQHRPPLERVVQDIEVPVRRTAEFVNWFLDTIPIEPIWLCPLRLPPNPRADADPTWPLYPIPAEKTYVNVGFWSTVPRRPGQPEGATNRLIEQRVDDLGGHKSLYSDAYYTPNEFADLYGGEAYTKLKALYDPESRLLNLYDKAVRRQ
jgi:FAD/FMN-containing dehydrogenase